MIIYEDPQKLPANLGCYTLCYYLNDTVGSIKQLRCGVYGMSKSQAEQALESAKQLNPHKNYWLRKQ